MRYLLDTHAAIWFFNGDERLSDAAKKTITAPTASVFVSIATVWELAIKIKIGKLSFDGGTAGFLDLIDDNGFALLPIERAHLLQLENLPFYHRDPFDRLLVACAIAEKMTLITIDENIRLYALDCVW